MVNLTIRLVGRCVHLVSDIRDCDSCHDRAVHVRAEAEILLLSEITRAVRGDALTQAGLRTLASSYGLLYNVHNIIDSTLLEHVAWLLETNRLIAVECAPVRDSGRVALSHASPQPPRPRPRPPQIQDLKTWIEIELLTEDRKPVPYEKYRITVPEGFVAEGALDANGRARIDGIDPGICEVSFPEIDARDMKQA